MSMYFAASVSACCVPAPVLGVQASMNPAIRCMVTMGPRHAASHWLEGLSGQTHSGTIADLGVRVKEARGLDQSASGSNKLCGLCEGSHHRHVLVDADERGVTAGSTLLTITPDLRAAAASPPW